MLTTTKRLVHDQNLKIRELENEVKTLKRKLQFSRTTINDLRYAKRQYQRHLASGTTP